jgi:hypothetical protein
MVSHEDLRTHLRRQPFVPLRITTSSGQSYDIAHPDFAFVTRRSLEIGEATPEDPGVPDRVHSFAILPITSVEEVPQPSGPGLNGPL